MSDITIDNLSNDPTQRAPLTAGRQDFASVTETVCRVTERPRTPPAWYAAFAVSVTLTGALFGFTTAWFGFPILDETFEDTRKMLAGKRARLKKAKEQSTE